MVNDLESDTVDNGEEVTYTYQVANAGNTALAAVSLVDDTPPCTDPNADLTISATTTRSWTSARSGPTAASRPQPTQL